MERRIFGPVPSRRLGNSLGINNIPHKICTYSCIYCQIGKAIKMQINRQTFYKPDKLVDEAKSVISRIKDNDKYPDYITLVPDGEPTLDLNLGVLIKKLKTLKIPVAVITNGSLLHASDIQKGLLQADYVSVKADTFNNALWHKINKPHKHLNFNAMISGIRSFARIYTGKLVTETMLLKGMNDTYDDLDATAQIIQTFEPDTAYIAIPTRPPAYKVAIPADEVDVNKAYHIFKEYIQTVELLTGYEGNAFSSTGNFREDILSITAVHPMREEAVLALLHKTNGNKNVLTGLIEEQLLRKLQYNDHTYYIRKFTR
jgi:wyosine [tRNA(Phe)-imidazoG37] synthetase (radical SAM superfamily)